MEEEKIDQKVVEEAIKQEAFDQAKEEVISDIVKFGIGFKCSTLLIIRRKYLDLNLSDMDLTLMEGHNIYDPADGLEPEG